MRPETTTGPMGIHRLLRHTVWAVRTVGLLTIACGVSLGCGDRKEGSGGASDDVAPADTDQPASPSEGMPADAVEQPDPSGDPAGAVKPGADSVTPGDELIVEDGDAVAPTLGAECARDSYIGERGDVNLYLLLDVSGSMLAPISAEEDAVTQWDAVRAAVTSFIEAPESSGFNLALNYYPIQGARADCSAFGTCAANVSCVVGLCDVSFLLGELRACDDSSQCPYVVDLGDGELYQEQCRQPGRCDNDEYRQCILDEQCLDGGVCLQHNRGLCPGETSCEPSVYIEPSVDRTVLPDSGATLVESLLQREPDPYGITPTHVALAGAYTRVDEWRQAEPGAKSVVVLATDGEPVGCALGDTPEQVRDEATSLTYGVVEAGASSGIQTFVIGVTPDVSGLPDEDRAEIEPILDELKDKLNQIANRGGTTASYNVTVNDDATAAFVAALEEIRGQVLPCEYVIPTPDTGAVSYDRLNVEVNTEGNSLVAPKVTDDSECVANELGWYYDVDASTQSPTRVVLCPSTCEQVNAVSGSRVDIVLGCQTVVRVR